MSGCSEGQTRECSIRIVDTVGILYKEDRRVCIFLESLCPDGIVIITVVICTCQRHIEQRSSCELSIEVDTVPSEVEIKTESQFRTVCPSDKSLVITIDLSVTVLIYILDISDIRTGSIPCRVVDFLLTPVKSVSLPYHDSSQRSADHLMYFRNVRCIRIHKPTCPGEGHSTCYTVIEWLSSCIEYILM